jgi:hypothetical protein
VRLRPHNEWLRVPARAPPSAVHGVHAVGGDGGGPPPPHADEAGDTAAAATEQAPPTSATAAVVAKGREYFKALREAAKLK